jgi:hypothetical protein
MEQKSQLLPSNVEPSLEMLSQLHREVSTDSSKLCMLLEGAELKTEAPDLIDLCPFQYIICRYLTNELNATRDC